MKKKALIFALTAVIFAGIFALILIFSKRKFEFPTDTDKMNIVVLGDSIMENDLDGNNVCSLLNNYIEANVINCAIGGSTAVSINGEKELDYYVDKFNFYNLADVAVSGNPASLLDNRYMVDWIMPGAIDKGLKLAYVDFDKVDCLIVNYGMNDTSLGIPASSDDKYDTATFGGVMRNGIEQIHKEYPNLKIVVNTVSYSHATYEIGQKEKVIDNGENGLQEAYNAELQSIVNDYDNVYLFDIKSCLDINENNYSDYLLDGIHLNIDAKKILAEALAEYLRELK